MCMFLNLYVRIILSELGYITQENLGGLAFGGNQLISNFISGTG